MSDVAPHFSHIYAESAALVHPRAQALIARFPKAQLVAIAHYKEVFNRPRQAWALQRRSRKLILALRGGDFLYPGAPVAPRFGFQHFYYNCPVLNCIYDCSYCYLQGLYPSANLVIFVNHEDFIAHTEAALAHEHPLYLCISYDTDLLALEGLLAYASAWIEFAARTPHLTIELRTKSVAYRSIAHLPPSPRVVLAWTLSPQQVITRYERRTPPLKARLAAIRAAIDDGWQVRICVDPILAVADWEKTYRDFVEEVFAAVPANKIHDVSLGTFRMNAEYLKKIRTQRFDSDILFYPFHLERGAAGYAPPLQQRMLAVVSEYMGGHLPREKLVFY